MLYVYGQLPLQTLLIVMDATFWVLTYFLIEFLSIINNPSTQVASVITSLGGFWRFFRSETKRISMRKTKSNDYELNQLPSPRPGSMTPDEYVSKGQFDSEPGISGYRVTTTETDLNNQKLKQNGNDNRDLYESGYGCKKFNFSTLLIFFSCIICTTYGSKILNLILSQNVSPSAEIVHLPVSEISKKFLNSTSDNSTLLPDNFDINSRWASNKTLYNTNVDFREVDKFENSMERVHLDDVGFATSAFLKGGVLFSLEVSEGSHLICGLSDKGTEIPIKRGSEVLYLDGPSVPLYPQLWCLKSTDNDSAVSYTFGDGKYQSDHTSSPGDNITLFGIDRDKGYIYASTVIYESSTFDIHDRSSLINTDGSVKNLTDYGLFDHLGFDITLDNSNVLLNPNNINTSYSELSNITEGIEGFSSLLADPDASFTLVFTVQDSSSVNSTDGALYNRVFFGYFLVKDVVVVTQAFYRTRLLHYKIHDQPSNDFISQWNSSMSEPWEFGGVQLLPIVSNIKVSPFVYGVIDKIFGFNSVGYSSLNFYFTGRLRYNVTSIVCSILSVFGLAMILGFLSKIILYKAPQGIPSYYGLLHLYHEKQFKVQQPLDAELERQSIFKVIDKAYEGVGYDAELQRNRMGVLDEATYRAGVKRNGVTKRRLL